MEQKQATIVKVDNDEIITLAGITTGRRFQVVGAADTAEKYLALLTYLIDMVNPNTGLPLSHNVRNIVLTTNGLPIDTKGKPALGMAHYSAATVIVNQAAHIDACYADLAGATHHTQFRAHLWIQTLLTAAHEITHMAKWHEEVLKGNIKAVLKMVRKDDDECEAFAIATLINMAKTIDLETPDLDEWHYFGSRVAQMESSFAGANTPWAAAQSMMLTDGIAYMDIGGNKSETRESVRDLLMAWSKDDPKTWPTTAVQKLELGHDAAQLATAAVADSPVVEPTAEQLAKAAADEAAVLQAAKDAKTAALKRNLQMEYRATMGVTETAVVDDDLLAIFLAGRGIKLSDLESLANPPAETVVQIQPNGSGTVVMGAAAPPAFMGEEDPYDGDDGGYSDDFDPSSEGGFGQPSEAADPAAAWANARASNQAAYAAVQPVPTMPAHGMNPVQAKATARLIYARVAEHIFNKCGWTQMQYQAPGQPVMTFFDFNNVATVAEPVFIGDIPGVDLLVVGMDCIDAQGRYMSNQPVLKDAQGRIFVKGHTTKDKRMPCYTLHINFGDGVVQKRMVMPQNPHKVKNGQLSKTAVDARQGHRYFYIFNKTVRDGGFVDGCKDGRWQDA